MKEYEITKMFDGHEGVVQVTDCAYTTKSFYIKQKKLYEYLSSEEDKDFRKQPLKIRLQKYLDLDLTITYIHDKEIVHGDIKPENIMGLDKDNSRLVVIDFGKAFKADEPEQSGTIYFKSPDLIFSQRANTLLDDYWAFLMSIFVIEFNQPKMPFYEECRRLQNGAYSINKKITFFDEDRVKRAKQCMEFLGEGIEEVFKSKQDEYANHCGETAALKFKEFLKNVSRPDFFEIDALSEIIYNGLKDTIDLCEEHIESSKTISESQKHLLISGVNPINQQNINSESTKIETKEIQKEEQNQDEEPNGSIQLNEEEIDKIRSSKEFKKFKRTTQTTLEKTKKFSRAFDYNQLDSLLKDMKYIKDVKNLKDRNKLIESSQPICTKKEGLVMI